MFLKWLPLCWLIGLLGVAAADNPPTPPDDHAAAITSGRAFLATLFDPEMGLLPEFPGHTVYWLYHDNYLAAKVLAKSHPDLADKIRASISRHGVKRSGKIELLFGEADLPLRRYELRDVAQVGGKVVRSEFTTDEINRGADHYADLLFFTALAEKDPVKARTAYTTAMAMWDGIGFRDAAMAHSGLYATYKLGLALRAAGLFADRSDAVSNIRAKLLKMQNSAGGWITDYKPDGSGVGKANVETTCLAILGLEAGAPPIACDLRPEFERFGLKQRSQGKRGTCSVFATVEATEFALARLTGKGTALSVEYANWAANDVTGRADDGDFFHNIIRGIEKRGICPQDAMPYARKFVPGTAPGEETVNQAAALSSGYRFAFHWIKGWSKRPGLQDSDVTKVKAVLASGFPIAAGSYHSVLFVGYEDNPALPGGGKFLIADSNLVETEISYQAAKERFCDMFWVSAETTATTR